MWLEGNIGFQILARTKFKRNVNTKCQQALPKEHASADNKFVLEWHVLEKVCLKFGIVLACFAKVACLASNFLCQNGEHKPARCDIVSQLIIAGWDFEWSVLCFAQPFFGECVPASKSFCLDSSKGFVGIVFKSSQAAWKATIGCVAFSGADGFV